MREKALKASIWLVAVFCVVAVWQSKVQSQELKKSGRYYVAEINKTYEVGDGGRLIVSEVRGNVEVTAGADGQVIIHEIIKMDIFTREEAEAAVRRSKSSYLQKGNVIEVGGGYHRRNWIQSEFDISVPASFDVEVETRGGDIEVGGVNGNVELSTSGGDITLKDIGGEVEVRTSGGDIVVINSRKKVKLKTSGGDIELQDIGGSLTAKTSGGDIFLRRAEGEVELKTSGGDIEIADVGGAVTAHTSGGDIEVKNTQGAVEVHTSGGDINLTKIGGALDASTSGGDISGRSIAGSASVSTSGGSIELADVKGGVEGKTAGGDIEVEITLTDFSGNHNIDLRTAGGEITLYIPEKLPATIRAEIEITDLWRDYNIYSDFPLTSSEDTEEGRRSRRRKRFVTSEGDINGGGDLIELYTTNGDIHIKMLRE